MPRTPKIVEDRREQIIEAATRVFAQKGFIRATNKDIAREAGITPGLIYHYFESKEALLQAILDERSPLRLIRTIQPEMLEVPPEILMRFFIGQVLNIIEDEKFVSLIRVFLPEVIHNPKIAPLGQAAIQEVIGFIGSYLRHRMDLGELRQTDEQIVAQTLIGCVMGFVLRRQVMRDPLALELSHEQIVESIVSTVLQGLLPR